MQGYDVALPARLLFGRGVAAQAPGLIAGLGPAGLVVHGADAGRAGWLVAGLRAQGVAVETLACPGEPTLEMLEQALARPRAALHWVAALGGGAALDMGKALAALIPAPGGVMAHLEVVGQGLPLAAAPLPFVALPTTAGTGAEATRNAVIGVPAHRRKVSLRDARMLARLAIVDPALTDGCPRGVTLASGLDAVTQVIEPYLSCRANAFTDALVRPVIGPGLAALVRLMAGQDRDARDTLAHVSLTGGIALANAGLGAVHGLAGVLGGVTGAAHGAICGALLGPVLAMNRARCTGPARQRVDEVCALIAAALGGSAAGAPERLADWARDAGLPGLAAQGLTTDEIPAVAAASALSSSMKGNPVTLTPDDLAQVLRAAL